MGLFMCNSPILIQSGLRLPALPPKSAKSDVPLARVFFTPLPMIQKGASHVCQKPML